MVSSSHLVSPSLAGVVSFLSLSFGFYLGVRGYSFKGADPQVIPPARRNEDPAASDDGDEVEVEEIADGDLSAVQAGAFEPCKLVLVVRTDLKMSPGKIATQCGHATLACYKALHKVNPQLIRHWEKTGQAKIALKGTSEVQLHELEAIAKSLNLCARSIHDQGLTEVEEGTRTVLGIGPAPVNVINEVTGKLRLL